MHSSDIHPPQAPPTLPWPEQRKLALAAASGDPDARNRLVEANLLYVWFMAKKEYAHTGVPIEDLVQEGSLGLIEAARRFDPARNWKFITYAVWWIRSYMGRLVESHATVRLPVNRQNDHAAIASEVEARGQAALRAPQWDEVAADMGYSDARRYPHIASTVNSPHGWDGPTDALDLVPAPDQTDEGQEASDAVRVLRDLLDTLPDREADVLRLRHGVDTPDGRPRTLKQIGETIGVTRERTRQIEQGALRKLAHLARKRGLSRSTV